MSGHYRGSSQGSPCPSFSHKTLGSGSLHFVNITERCRTSLVRTVSCSSSFGRGHPKRGHGFLEPLGDVQVSQSTQNSSSTYVPWLIFEDTAPSGVIYGDPNVHDDVLKSAKDVYHSALVLLTSVGIETNATLDMNDADFGNENQFAVFPERRPVNEFALQVIAEMEARMSKTRDASQTAVTGVELSEGVEKYMAIQHSQSGRRSGRLGRCSKSSANVSIMQRTKKRAWRRDAVLVST